MKQPLVWIKGAGDLATGVAFRLWRAGFAVYLSELAEPLCVRRTVSFAEAVTEGRWTVEGLTAVLVVDEAGVEAALGQGFVPVAVDADGSLGRRLGAAALVDAILAKTNTGTSLADAPVVVALGPGFTAGVDCHAVIETQRGHWLGRALYSGSAAPDTGTPGEVAGVKGARVLRAPVAGRFAGHAAIGAMVAPGQVLGEVSPAGGGSPVPVAAEIGGVLRGLIRTGIQVEAGLKIGDIDPTDELERCYTISDKSLAIAGGVLEAILHKMAKRKGE